MHDRKRVFLLCLCAYWLQAGDLRQPAVTRPIGISDDTGLYLEGALGQFALTDLSTSETLKVKTMMAGIGYAFNQYAAVEGRYYRGYRNRIDYHHGQTQSPDKIYKSTLTDLAAYLKLSYPMGQWSPYILLGYGQTKLTNIEGGDRRERGWQYGVGLRYRATEHVSVFADWMRAYGGRGFDGRAREDTIHVDFVSAGFGYRF